MQSHAGLFIPPQSTPGRCRKQPASGRRNDRRALFSEAVCLGHLLLEPAQRASACAQQYHPPSQVHGAGPAPTPLLCMDSFLSVSRRMQGAVSEAMASLLREPPACEEEVLGSCCWEKPWGLLTQWHPLTG